MATTAATMRMKCASTKIASTRKACRSTKGIVRAVRTERKVEKSQATKEGMVLRMGTNVALFNAILALPSEAAGKIFDFNLTLPIIAAEFLLLMVLLDTVWFNPVGKVLDERDSKIRSKLVGMKDNTAEIKRLQDEAEAIVGQARKEAQDAIAKAKAEAESQCAAEMAEAKKKVDLELEQAIASLQAQKDTSLASLDEQVRKLSDEIVSKLLPV